MKSAGRRIAILAVFGALTVVFTPIPYVFLLPVLLASIWFDWATAAAMSALFGVASYLFSFLGGSPIGIAFVQYPWVAIVPRLFVGLAARGVWALLHRLTASAHGGFLRFALPAALAGMVGSLVNTGGVLGCFLLFLRDVEILGTAMPVLVAGWAISGAIEAAVALVATPSVDAAGRKVLVRTSFRSGR